MPDVRLHRQVRLDRADDVVDALVAFVVGVVDAGGVGAGGEPRVEVAQIAVVDERPVVVAVADHADQAVARGLEDVADHAVAAAVDHAGPHHHRPQMIARRVEHELLVRRSERRQRDRVDRRVLGHRLRRLAENPDARRVDDEPLGRRGGARRAGPLRGRNEGFERRQLDRRAAARRRVERGVDVAVLRLGAAAERVEIREVADHRMRAALGDARAFSLLRTSAVTSCPPRTSASRTAAPM